MIPLRSIAIDSARRTTGLAIGPLLALTTSASVANAGPWYTWTLEFCSSWPRVDRVIGYVPEIEPVSSPAVRVASSGTPMILSVFSFGFGRLVSQ